MNSNFFDSVIQATNNVITVIRCHAYKGTDSQTLARMLDYADPLGFVLMDHFPAKNEEERIAHFQQRLQDIEETFSGFSGFVARFDQNMDRGEVKSEQSRELAAASA